MTEQTSISEEILPLAAEDRFLLIGIRDAPQLCPSNRSTEILSWTIGRLNRVRKAHDLVVDLRGLAISYNDVEDFIANLEFEFDDASLLVGSSEQAVIRSSPQLRRYRTLVANGPMHPMQPFDLGSIAPASGEVSDWIREAAYGLERLVSDAGSLRQFERRLTVSEVERALRSEAPRARALPELLDLAAQIFVGALDRVYEEWSAPRTILGHWTDVYEEMRDIDAIDDHLRSAYLAAYIESIRQYSLLTQFAMLSQGDEIVCVPLHGSGVHEIETLGRNANIIVARPEVIAHRTHGLFSQEIRELEQLLNSPGVAERRIEALLERYPNFLRGLGYQNVYPQVVLTRYDGTSLRPDFILEPVEGEWCDILDLKLPQ